MLYARKHDLSSRIGHFMYAVYGFMATALMLTAFVAYYVSVTPSVSNYIFTHPMIMIGLFIAQITLAIGITAAIRTISFTTALTLFFVYAILMGVTLSSVFVIYKIASIYKTFAVTSAMFGGMCIYGYFTRSDLNSIGSMSIMIVWGMVVAMFVNMFWRSTTFDLVISAVGVIVFALLTAYDTQKIKMLAQEISTDDESLAKIAVIGALTLYLDFINLFLFLLRFMGERRDGR